MPSAKTWRFQIGSRNFTWSTSWLHSSKAWLRCAVLIAATNGDVAHLQRADPVADRDAVHLGSRRELGGDLGQDLDRPWMRFVLELGHRPAVVEIANNPAEHDVRPSSGDLDRLVVGRHVERIGRDDTDDHLRVGHTPPPGRWSPPAS